MVKIKFVKAFFYDCIFLIFDISKIFNFIRDEMKPLWHGNFINLR
jgi:hypothetical protein